MTNHERIEELETALENLLDNCEAVTEEEFCTNSLREAIVFAEQVLWDEGYEYDTEDEG